MLLGLTNRSDHSTFLEPHAPPLLSIPTSLSSSCSLALMVEAISGECGSETEKGRSKLCSGLMQVLLALSFLF